LAVHVARVADGKRTEKSVVKSKGKRQFERPVYRVPYVTGTELRTWNGDGIL